MARLRILPVALGQLVDDDHGPRVLVGRDALAEVVGGDVTAVAQDDDGGDLLAEHGVGDADDCGLLDVGVLVEDLLDLARVDVVAARMIMSFLRSMMYRYPSSSARATSPVWNRRPA
jgi:hypothetical protein